MNEDENKYYECSECRHFRVDEKTGDWYCRRSCNIVSPYFSACDDFELDN